MGVLALFVLLISRAVAFFSLFLLAVLVASLVMPREMFEPMVGFFRHYRPGIKRMYEEVRADQIRDARTQKRKLAKRQDGRGREIMPLGRLAVYALRFLGQPLVVTPLEWLNSQLLRLVAWEEKELEPYDRFFG